MAYRGGYFVKPVESDYTGFSQRYTQGKKAAEAVRENVRKQRSAELQALVEASDFEYTGVSEIDNAYMAAATKMREEVVNAHKANIRGEMSRTEATAAQNRYLSQANKISRIAEFKAQGAKDIQELIDKGEASQLELDLYMSDWIVPKGENQTYIDQDGNMQMSGRRMVVDMIGDKTGKKELAFIVETSYPDAEGNIVTNYGYRGINESVNTDRDRYRAITAQGRADEFFEITAKKKFLPTGPNGELTANPLYGYTTNVAGSQYKFSIENKAGMSSVRNTLEMNLQATSASDKLSILYDAGARIIGSPDAPSLRSTEEIDQVYNSGGNGNLYDKDGNNLTLSSDPLLIQLDPEGLKPILTEDQEAYVDALIRANYYNRLDVTVDKIRGTFGGAGGGKTKELGDVPRLKYNKNVNWTKANPGKPTEEFQDVQYLDRLIYGEALAMDAVQKGDMASLNQWQLESDIQGRISKPVPGAVGISEQGGQLAGSFGMTGVSPALEKVLDVTSQGRVPMDNFSGWSVVKYDNGVVAVRLIGESKISDYQNLYKSGGGVPTLQNQKQVGLEQEVRIQALSQNLNPSQSKELLKVLYYGTMDFNQWMQSKGYGVSGGTKSAEEILWEYYEEN